MKSTVTAICFLAAALLAGVATVGRTAPDDLREKHASLIEQMSSRFLEDRQAAIDAVLAKPDDDRRAMLPRAGCSGRWARTPHLHARR